MRQRSADRDRPQIVRSSFVKCIRYSVEVVGEHYKALLRRVWLWKDWPGRRDIDHGIDLVAEDRDGNIWAELNLLEFCGTTEGLRAEMGRIRAWIDEQAPGQGAELLPAVLEYVGFDYAEWYRRVLSGG